MFIDRSHKCHKTFEQVGYLLLKLVALIRVYENDFELQQQTRENFNQLQRGYPLNATKVQIRMDKLRLRISIDAEIVKSFCQVCNSTKIAKKQPRVKLKRDEVVLNIIRQNCKLVNLFEYFWTKCKSRLFCNDTNQYFLNNHAADISVLALVGSECCCDDPVRAWSMQTIDAYFFKSCQIRGRTYFTVCALLKFKLVVLYLVQIKPSKGSRFIYRLFYYFGLSFLESHLCLRGRAKYSLKCLDLTVRSLWVVRVRKKWLLRGQINRSKFFVVTFAERSLFGAWLLLYYCLLLH